MVSLGALSSLIAWRSNASSHIAWRASSVILAPVLTSSVMLESKNRSFIRHCHLSKQMNCMLNTGLEDVGDRIAPVWDLMDAQYHTLEACVNKLG